MFENGRQHLTLFNDRELVVVPCDRNCPVHTVPHSKLLAPLDGNEPAPRQSILGNRRFVSWALLWFTLSSLVLLFSSTALSEEVGAANDGPALNSAIQEGQKATSPDATKKNSPDKLADHAAMKKRVQERIEMLKLFIDALEQIDRNYVEKVDRRELIEAAIDGMLDKLDPYSDFVPPDEIKRFQGNIENRFAGIGVQVSIEGEYITVISPIFGSPAYDAGINAGDKIVRINGIDAKGMQLEDAVKLTQGKPGTTVKMGIRRYASGDEVEMEILRAIVIVQSVLGYQLNENDQWDFYADKEKRIGYIRLSSFSRKTTIDLYTTLSKLKKEKMEGLILDLRYNPGGLLSTAIQVSDIFLKEGKIVSTKGRSVRPRSWEASEAGTFSDFPMVVLVNKFSASASEIVSASLKDNRRATIVGERTFGKGSVQNVIDLENGESALKLTTAGYFRPNGKNIHRKKDSKDEDEWGVRPSDGFEVKFTPEESEKYLAYRRALDVFGSKKPGTKTERKIPTFEDKQLKKAMEFLTTTLKKSTQEPQK